VQSHSGSRPKDMSTAAPSPRSLTMITELANLRRGVGPLVVYVLLGLLSAVFILPIVWMLSTSLKPLDQVNQWPPSLLPQPAVWANYPDALTFLPFGRFLFNTTTIAVLSIVGTLLSCTLVAYGFARIRFPGRDVLFIILISTIMLPETVRLIPTFLLYNQIGWLNTYLPLVVPSFLANPFYVFLLRQFFRTIPEELADAARIDGCGELAILGRIFVPLSGPALAVITIFTFQTAWNDFMGPLIYLNDANMRTLSLGLYYFLSFEGVTKWNQMMAAATVMVLPILTIFAFFQRYFIQGVTLTGIKG
jgi:multiple sugar transport system permease protein